MRGRERGLRRAVVDRTACATAILVFLSTSVFFTLIHYEDSWISHIHLEVRDHVPHVHYDGGGDDGEEKGLNNQLSTGGASSQPRDDMIEPAVVVFGGQTAASDASLGQNTALREGKILTARLVGPNVLGDVAPGTSVFVTFATGHMADFALNWVGHARRLGLSPLVVGALDQEMHDLCVEEGVPSIFLNGSSILQTGPVKYFNTGNPAFKRMGGIKTLFVWELLNLGLQPVLTDADAVWLRDPREYFQRGSLAAADVLVSSDCIEVPNDEQWEGGGECDTTVNFNTGTLFFRNTPSALEFVGRWHEKVTQSEEKWMRDQPAFNLLARGADGLQMRISNPERAKGDRALLVGADGLIKLGVLPPRLFANGHTFFIQRGLGVSAGGGESGTGSGDGGGGGGQEGSYSVHLTYQYGDAPEKAYGKRQRLRQAGLWLADPPDYFSGRFITVADSGASFPPVDVGNNGSEWRRAIRRHFAEDLLRRRTVRNLLAAARALNRTAVLPRALCYCDKMWNNLQYCRAAGAWAMPLPFECPMDHIYLVHEWFREAIPFREAGFLRSPLLPVEAREGVEKVFVDRRDGLNRHGTGDGGGGLPALNITDGLTDAQLRDALAPLESAPVIELSQAEHLLCGLSAEPLPEGSGWASDARTFARQLRKVLDHRLWFCLSEPWDEMGRPGLVLGHEWERDVVKRHCLKDEVELLGAGYVRFGVVQDDPSCACEWCGRHLIGRLTRAPCADKAEGGRARLRRPEAVRRC